MTKLIPMPFWPQCIVTTVAEPVFAQDAMQERWQLPHLRTAITPQAIVAPLDRRARFNGRVARTRSPVGAPRDHRAAP